MIKVIQTEKFYLDTPYEDFNCVTRIELENGQRHWFDSWDHFNKKNRVVGKRAGELEEMYERRPADIHSTPILSGGCTIATSNDRVVGYIAETTLFAHEPKQDIFQVPKEKDSYPEDFEMIFAAASARAGNSMRPYDVLDLLTEIKHKVAKLQRSWSLNNLMQDLEARNTFDQVKSKATVLSDGSCKLELIQPINKVLYSGESRQEMREILMNYHYDPAKEQDHIFKVGDVVSGYPVLRSVHGKERVEGIVIEINGKWGEHINIEREVKPTNGGGKETIVLEGSTVVKLKQDEQA